MAKVYIRETPIRYANYRRAVETVGSTVQFGGDASGCDALLLPGGGDMEPRRYGQKNTASRGLEPERDKAELTLIADFLAAGKPVLGICRGMQVLNVFFGGTLAQDIADHSAVNGIDRRHTIQTAASPLRPICGATCQVNSAHHQAVDRLGAGLKAVQWAPDGIVEAVCHQTLPVWGVQWHPERLQGPLGLDLIGTFLTLCH